MIVGALIVLCARLVARWDSCVDGLVHTMSAAVGLTPSMSFRGRVLLIGSRPRMGGLSTVAFMSVAGRLCGCPGVLMVPLGSGGPVLDTSRGLTVVASGSRDRTFLDASLKVVWMLLRVGIVCRDGPVPVVVAVVALAAHDSEAFPDQKDGDPAERKRDHSNDSNAVLNGTAFAVLNIEETHVQVVVVGLLP